MNNQLLRHVLGLLLLVSTQLSVAQMSDQRPQLQALFLYKFTDYVTWPNDPEVSRIGVAGSPEVLLRLREFQQTRPRLQVVEVKAPADVEGLQILFLASSLKGEYKEFMKPLNGESTLIVCEDKGDMRWGVDIAFFENKGRMSYLVDQSSLERRKLLASGKLLGLGAER